MGGNDDMKTVEHTLNMRRIARLLTKEGAPPMEMMALT
jgi:hypothetical protein